MQQKEFLYVGHYIDVDGNFILKIGTTNDLARRAKEHNRTYRNAIRHKMASDSEFVYDWHIALSKYSTLRYEDKNREIWMECGIGEFVKNDRFVCSEKPKTVSVTIRKTYVITLE